MSDKQPLSPERRREIEAFRKCLADRGDKFPNEELSAKVIQDLLSALDEAVESRDKRIAELEAQLAEARAE